MIKPLVLFFGAALLFFSVSEAQAVEANATVAESHVEGDAVAASQENPADAAIAHGSDSTQIPPLEYVPEFRENSSYGFRKTRWGMSPDEVKAAEGREPTRSETTSSSGVYRIGYKDVDLFGVKIWLVYSFVDGKLWGAGYAKDKSYEGEFDKIAAKALAYYGDTKLAKENNLSQYNWSQDEDTKVSLRHVSDPLLGNRIFLDFINKKFSPEEMKKGK